MASLIPAFVFISEKFPELTVIIFYGKIECHLCITPDILYQKIYAMRTVKKILQQKGPHFNHIDENATVLDAIARMKTENISYLIVLCRGKYVGIISERDYAQKLIFNNKSIACTLVREIMTRDLPIVSGEQTGEHCMLLMNASQSRYLPVFDGSEFRGVITIHDLMREAIRDKQKVLNEKQAQQLHQHYWI